MILEEPADLVLNIPLDLNEQSSADKKGFGRVTVKISDADFLVPPTLRDARNTHSVTIMPGIDADAFSDVSNMPNAQVAL
jgi:hypothetical protein